MKLALSVTFLSLFVACVTDSSDEQDNTQTDDNSPTNEVVKDTIIAPNGDTLVVLEDGTSFLIGEFDGGTSSNVSSENTLISSMVDDNLSSEIKLSSSSLIVLSSSQGLSSSSEGIVVSSSQDIISSSTNQSSSSVEEWNPIELAQIGSVHCEVRGFENYDTTQIYQEMDTIVAKTTGNPYGGIYVSVDVQINVHPTTTFRLENSTSGKSWDEDPGHISEMVNKQKWVKIGACTTYPQWTSGMCEGTGMWSDTWDTYGNSTGKYITYDEYANVWDCSGYNGYYCDNLPDDYMRIYADEGRNSSFLYDNNWEDVGETCWGE